MIISLSLREVLDEAIQKLKAFPTPQLDAEILLSFVLNKPRSFLYAYPEHLLTAEQQTQLDHVMQRHLQGEPLAYITQQKEFWSLLLHLTPDVLIPRPETELLVEKCLVLLPKDKNLTVVDLGTGSGAIALALATECPNWHVIATDQSHAALAVAKKNAESLNINNIKLYQGDWCAALPHEKFAAIISNPPYIDQDDPELDSNVRNFEPQQALISSDNGLADLKIIALQAKNYLQNGGWLLLEHGYRQGEAIASYLQELSYQNVETLSDLSGLPRVTVGFFYKTDLYSNCMISGD